MDMFVPACPCVYHRHAGALRGLKRAPDPRDWQVVVSLLVNAQLSQLLLTVASGMGRRRRWCHPAVRYPGRQRNGNLERANGFNVPFWADFRCPPANCHSRHTCQGTQLLRQTWPVVWFCVALEAIHCLYSFKWLGKKNQSK